MVHPTVPGELNPEVPCCSLDMVHELYVLAQVHLGLLHGRRRVLLVPGGGSVWHAWVDVGRFDDRSRLLQIYSIVDRRLRVPQIPRLCRWQCHGDSAVFKARLGAPVLGLPDWLLRARCHCRLHAVRGRE